MGQSSMGKRRLRLTGAEQDALTGWRKFYCWKPSVISEIKRGYRRRERNAARQELREHRYDE